MSLQQIVDVQINVEASRVTRQGFGTLLFLGLSKVFTDRVRTYTSVQGLLDDGFAAGSAEVAAATALFSQEVTPTSIKIGRRQSDTATVTPSTVVDNTNYTVTINGTDFTINSGAGATADSIATALDVAINAGAEPVTSTDLTGSISLTADVAGTPYSLTTSDNLTVAVATAGAETLTTALSEVRDADDDWYVLASESHAVADILELAALIEPLSRLYAVSSSDADILTTGTTDIVSQLAAFNYDRTFVLYEADADLRYPEVAWAGVMLPKDPGSATWSFKTLVGEDVDALTPTETQNVLNKNGNVYETCGGVDITRFGTVVSGEFIDVIRGIDWLEARMRESIFAVIADADKIPYTDAGVAIIENEIDARLQDAIAAGVLAADPAPTITVPVVADIPSATKVTRCLPTITFNATLSGAIHKAVVRGTVTV